MLDDAAARLARVRPDSQRHDEERRRDDVAAERGDLARRGHVNRPSVPLLKPRSVVTAQLLSLQRFRVKRFRVSKTKQITVHKLCDYQSLPPNLRALISQARAKHTSQFPVLAESREKKAQLLTPRGLAVRY